MNVKIVSTDTITPAPYTGSVIDLSPLDMSIPPYHTSFAWATCSTDVDQLLTDLAALMNGPFSFLAGNLRDSETGLWSIHPSPKPTPYRVVRAECPIPITSVKTNPPVGLAPLTNPAIGEPVAIFQITRFLNGLVIAMNVHHRLMDARAQVEFGRYWFGRDRLTAPPFVLTSAVSNALSEKTLLHPGGGLQTPADYKTPTLGFSVRGTTDAGVVSRAVAEARTVHAQVTPNDVVCAAIWIAHARSLKDSNVELGIVLDMRRTIGLSHFAFGSPLLFATLQGGDCSLTAAAVRIREEILTYRSKDTVAAVSQWCSANVAKGFSNPVTRGMDTGGCGVTNWRKVGVTAYDYGYYSGELYHCFAPPSGFAFHGLTTIQPGDRNAPEGELEICMGLYERCVPVAIATLVEMLGGRFAIEG